jgi:hypothetical protein
VTRSVRILEGDRYPPLVSRSGQIFDDACILQTPLNRKKRAIEWGTQQLCGPTVQLFLGLYNFNFGNFKEGFHAFLEVLRGCRRPLYIRFASRFMTPRPHISGTPALIIGQGFARTILQSDAP